MLSIAALLTCHNRKAKTLECLRSLHSCSLPEGYAFDVYLVDDGSTDGTSESVKCFFPTVQIVRGDGNLYWNRGMYLAWQVAARKLNYDFYLWLNDDTILFTNAIQKLLEVCFVYENKVIAVGACCPIGNEEQISYGGRLKRKGLLPFSEGIQNCDFFNGNCVLIPKYVYKKIGMNDPLFHHALGDFDYGLRASKLGIKSVVAPEVTGQCNINERLSDWCNPQQTFRKRWKSFRTPLGQNPEEAFIFEKRHNGLLIACMHYITNHVRVIIPKLWK